jgi:hypothetical protein
MPGNFKVATKRKAQRNKTVIPARLGGAFGEAWAEAGIQSWEKYLDSHFPRFQAWQALDLSCVSRE